MDEGLFHDGVAELHGAARFVLAPFRQFPARERHAADAVTSGQAAHQHESVADTVRAVWLEPVPGKEPEARDIDERVLGVGGV
ncbi:MAG: hypothetical protein L3J77_05705, partial [Thermoplasmata archaeon]|nr:hypothetical protein [Thermoplasmata archaeon]